MPSEASATLCYHPREVNMPGPIVLDFETYYDKDYSLRKLNPALYLLDPRFECIGCAVIDELHFGSRDPIWLDGVELTRYLAGYKFRQQQGEKLVVACHNALFDMSLLAWRFGVIPDLMIDTMAMARSLVWAWTGAVSLAKVAEHLGLPQKGTTIKHVTGMRAADIKAAGLWHEYKEYACNDAVLCDQIFNKLKVDFPRSEYEIMDTLIRMVVDPAFELDSHLLAEHKANIDAHKENLLTACGLTSRMELMSNDKFADALRRLGVEPPTKVTPKGNIGYAFAKSDPDMIALEDHPDERVQALVAARLGHKSTIEQTRTDTLLKMSLSDWPNGRRGLAPIPLRYSGAHTHRLSGDWKLNAQNWPRMTVGPDGTKETGKLRRAHKAPEGHKVVKCDASQIEARIVAWLAGQDDLVQAFREGRDIYSEFAGESVYHYPVSKKTPDERFVGKNAILGLGFGMGAPKFASDTAAKSYVTLGRSIIIDDPASQLIVRAYRGRYPRIPEAWDRLKNAIPEIARNTKLDQEFGPVRLQHQSILLPNGHRLFYRDLAWRDNDKTGKGEWSYYYGREPKRVFGGKLYENIVQALARIVTMNAAVSMRRQYPTIPLRHQVHDDLVYVVPDPMVEEFADALEATMSEARDWYADLPLAAERGVGPNYGDAK